MSRIRPALQRVLFLLRGGNRLNGCVDEYAARSFHLMLTGFLGWAGVMAALVVPLFAARKAAVAGLFLAAGGTAAISLVLLRRGHKRASAALLLTVLWCAQGVFSLFSGGIHSGSPHMALVIVAGAAWVLGLNPALGFAAATLLLSLAEALLESTGHSLPVYFPGAPMALWAAEAGVLILGIGPIAGFLDTLRRQVAALRESEERFRSLSDASFEALMVHDRGVILDTNLAFARLFGYEHREELIGLNTLEHHVGPDSRARVLERLQRREDGALEVTCVRKDGTTFPAEIESRSIRYLGRDARLIAGRDITERKRALEALRESEARYAALFERSLDCVFLTDFERHLLDANKAALDLLGYQRGDIATLGYESLLTEDQLPLALRTMEEILDCGYQKNRTEFRLRRKDGGDVFVETQSSLIYRNGKPVAIQSIGRDITERKRAEQENAKLEAQLHQAHKMESIGRLAGGIAHDFNNLLTVINGYSAVLKRQLDGPQRKHAEQILKAGESAASLTRQLLSFSRMEVAHPEALHLNDIVAESRDMLDRLLGEHIEIGTSLQAFPDDLLADPGQIHQCLMNLVVNARDAMPAGGHLTIETGNVEVAPDDFPPGSSGTPGPHVRLTVRDTGIGMDEETRRLIFEPFFTTKEKGGGTGLGLSTVYGIVSRWQGFLKVESETGKGSEFSILLPLNRTAKAQRDAPPVEAGPLPAVSETVLVVEDQDIVKDFVVESLRMCGYAVLEARNGREALQVIEQNGAGIHLMLTDIMMPGMRGPELAARANSVQPSMKVLFMTGYADGSIDGIGPDGRDDVILKPFAAEALIARVRDLLNPNRASVLN